MTGHGVVPEPSSITVFNPSYPGWWDTPDKHALLDSFTTESDPVERIPIWQKLQAQFYIDVPTVKVGAGFTTFGASKKIGGYYSGHLAMLLEHQADGVMDRGGAVFLKRV